jgi:hypothetical protein
MMVASLGSSLKLAPAPTRPVTYTLPGATCASCHRSPHGTQFASRKDNGACQSCHDVGAWAPASRFVHDANGGFTLGTAHEHLPCARCHVPATTKPGDVRTWRGVSRACEACHANGVRRS